MVGIIPFFVLKPGRAETLLIFTRKAGQKIRIGDDTEITVLEIRRGCVKIGIKAPRGLSIHREEVYRNIIEENLSAAESVFNPEVRLDDMDISIADRDSIRKKE